MGSACARQDIKSFETRSGSLECSSMYADCTDFIRGLTRHIDQPTIALPQVRSTPSITALGGPLLMGHDSLLESLLIVEPALEVQLAVRMDKEEAAVIHPFHLERHTLVTSHAFFPLFTDAF